MAYKVVLLLVFFSVFKQAYSDPVEFKLFTDSGEVTSEDLRGSVVYIDFWASWCAPCRESFPWMNEMHDRYKDQGLKMIAVSLDKSREQSAEFLRKLPANFLVGYDPEGQLAEQFKLVGMPSAYILDRNGELVKTHVGFRNSKRVDYEKSIKKVLAGS